MARQKKIVIKTKKDINEIELDDPIHSAQKNCGYNPDELYGRISAVYSEGYYKFQVERLDGKINDYPEDVFERWFYVKVDSQ